MSEINNDLPEKSPLRTPTNQSKIVKYGLVEECLRLRREGYSYRRIADELNATGKVPDDDKIDQFVVERFLKKFPELEKEIVANDTVKLVTIVNKQFDLIEEINELYIKSKMVLEQLEADARARGRNIDPYRFKAVASEMRELLKQMIEIQKEINDYNNVRKFMEIVMSVLQEEVPDKIPIIIEKLKIAKGTQWFANMMRKKVEQDDSF